jgi:hypothetical protein
VTPRVITVEESSRSLEANVPVPIAEYNFYEKIIANLEQLKRERQRSAKRLSGEQLKRKTSEIIDYYRE